MADAILTLFPGTQLTIGPVVEDGFYYDILLPEGKKISDNDFNKIEQQIKKLQNQLTLLSAPQLVMTKQMSIMKDTKNIDY